MRGAGSLCVGACTAVSGFQTRNRRRCCSAADGGALVLRPSPTHSYPVAIQSFWVSRLRTGTRYELSRVLALAPAPHAYDRCDACVSCVPLLLPLRRRRTRVRCCGAPHCVIGGRRLRALSRPRTWAATSAAPLLLLSAHARLGGAGRLWTSRAPLTKEPRACVRLLPIHYSPRGCVGVSLGHPSTAWWCVGYPKACEHV